MLSCKQRLDQGIVNKSGILADGKKAKTPAHTAVLGKGLLSEVRADTDRLGLPSWVAPAPRNAGSKSHGSLNADQWRAFCFINLSHTLTRIWGLKHKDSREYRMLVNFLNLVMAVKVATKRSVSPDDISLYNHHIRAYLNELLQLYPGTTITPYQHLCLHFGSLLQRFGPTHAWRCFPFERCNYILQNIPTNSRFGEKIRLTSAMPSHVLLLGELECTMMKRFCMAQNIRSIFKSGELPEAFNELIDTFESRYDTDIRGTLRGDSLVFDETFNQYSEIPTWGTKDLTMLPQDIFSSLRNWIQMNDEQAQLDRTSSFGFIQKQVRRLGVAFRTRDVFLPDSHIYFLDLNNTQSAGSIVSIFSHTRLRVDGTTCTQTFFAVRGYVPLSSTHKNLDPYRTFFPVTGQLYYDKLGDDVVVVSCYDNIYHFAHAPVSLPDSNIPCLLALPLDKVRFFFSSCKF